MIIFVSILPPIDSLEASVSTEPRLGFLNDALSEWLVGSRKLSLLISLSGPTR